MYPIRHFRTITHHRHLVQKYCFRVGLYWRGLTHDLSKYSPTEFWRGARYQGTFSPTQESAGRMAIRWRGCATRAAIVTILSTGQM
ncbi:MAG: DUF5662 family protein [Angelakisella sp.]